MLGQSPVLGDSTLLRDPHRQNDKESSVEGCEQSIGHHSKPFLQAGLTVARQVSGGLVPCSCRISCTRSSGIRRQIGDMKQATKGRGGYRGFTGRIAGETDSGTVNTTIKSMLSQYGSGTAA